MAKAAQPTVTLKHLAAGLAAEHEMAAAWERAKGKSRLTWEQARHAAKSGYTRVATANAETVRLGV